MSSFSDSLLTAGKVAGAAYNAFDFIQDPSVLNAGDVIASGLAFTGLWPVGLAWSVGRTIGGLLGKKKKVKYKSGTSAEFPTQNAYNPDTGLVYFKIRKKGEDETFAYSLNDNQFYKVGGEDAYERIENENWQPTFEEMDPLDPEEAIKEMSTVDKKHLRVNIFNPRTFQSRMYNEVLKDTDYGRAYLAKNAVKYGDMWYDPQNKLIFNEDGDMVAYVSEDNKIYATIGSHKEKKKVGNEPDEGEMEKIMRGEFLGEVRNGVPYINARHIEKDNLKWNLDVEEGEVPLSMIKWSKTGESPVGSSGKIRDFDQIYQLRVDDQYAGPETQIKYYTSDEFGTTFAVDPAQYEEGLPAFPGESTETTSSTESTIPPVSGASTEDTEGTETPVTSYIPEPYKGYSSINEYLANYKPEPVDYGFPVTSTEPWQSSLTGVSMADWEQGRGFNVEVPKPWEDSIVEPVAFEPIAPEPIDLEPVAPEPVAPTFSNDFWNLKTSEPAEEFPGFQNDLMKTFEQFQRDQDNPFAKHRWGR